GEGTNYKIYEKLGAHEREFDGVKGIHFAVWAPNAKAVSVIGEFNHWTNGTHTMENVNNSGVWVLFIPGIGEGELYKYAIRSKEDETIRYKSDPYAFYSQMRPETASVTRSLDKHKWEDDEWMEKRREWDYKREPVSIYEVHLCSWKRDFDKE